MNKPGRAILLLQVISSTTVYAYESTLEQNLRAAASPEDVLLTLDNFSDAVTAAYGKKLMDESKNLILVLDVQASDQKLGSLLGILNHLIRRTDIRCFHNGECKQLTPFYSKWKSQMFRSVDELAL